MDNPNYARHQLLGVGTVIQAPDGRESRVLVRDTWNTDILSELAPEPDDIVLYKHRFSGFFETELDTVLKRLGAKHLIVIGCTTSICVEATIRDAMLRDYSCVLLEDCTGEPIGHDLPRSNHDASLSYDSGAPRLDFVIRGVHSGAGNAQTFVTCWRGTALNH